MISILTGKLLKLHFEWHRTLSRWSRQLLLGLVRDPFLLDLMLRPLLVKFFFSLSALSERRKSFSGLFGANRYLFEFRIINFNVCCKSFFCFYDSLAELSGPFLSRLSLCSPGQ